MPFSFASAITRCGIVEVVITPPKSKTTALIFIAVLPSSSQDRLSRLEMRHRA